MITISRRPHRARRAPDPPPGGKPEPPKAVGGAAVAALAEYPPLVFRGETYPVTPRISYLDAIELHRRWLELLEIQAKPLDNSEIARAWGDAVAAVIGQCYQFLDPKPRENPFAGADPAEVGEIVGFFFARLRLRALAWSARAGDPER